jgi:hypothetical protein
MEGMLRNTLGTLSCIAWAFPLAAQRGGLWAKHMGLKRGTIGNTLEEHIGNLGNLKGTENTY